MMLAQVGGLIEIMETIFMVLTLPVSQFLFFYVMIKRMFLVKTVDDNLFNND